MDLNRLEGYWIRNGVERIKFVKEKIVENEGKLLLKDMEYNEFCRLSILIRDIKGLKKLLQEQKAKRKIEVSVTYENNKKEFTIEEFLTRLGFEME